MTTTSLTSTEQALLERIRTFDKTPREILVERAPTTVIDFLEGSWRTGRSLSPGETVIVTPERIPVAADHGAQESSALPGTP